MTKFVELGAIEALLTSKIAACDERLALYAERMANATPSPALSGEPARMAAIAVDIGAQVAARGALAVALKHLSHCEVFDMPKPVAADENIGSVPA